MESRITMKIIQATQIFLFLYFCFSIGSISSKPVASPDQSPGRDPPKPSSIGSTNKNSPSEAQGTKPKNGNSNQVSPTESGKSTEDGSNKSNPLPIYLQLAPAICMVFLFALGIIIIVTIQKKEENKKKRKQLNPLEEDNFGTIWISHLKQVRKKSTILERLKSPNVLGIGDKQKKYELYESMLEKYREDIEIKRQMFSKSPAISRGNSAMRLKQLAMLHRTMSEGSESKEDYKPLPWQQELQAMQEEADKEALEIQNEAAENTISIDVTPASAPNATSVMNFPQASSQITIKTSVEDLPKRKNANGLSYYREDSKVNSINENEHASLLNTDTSLESDDTYPLLEKGESPIPLQHLRSKPKPFSRARPKSWMATISSAALRGKKALSRPRSLLVSQQAIDEGPELEPLDFESLHKYKFTHVSDKDMAKMITAVEEKMIREVVESKHDLSVSEIDALEKLLDEVSKFCDDYCARDWTNKRQYSLEIEHDSPCVKAKRVIKHQQSLPAYYYRERSYGGNGTRKLKGPIKGISVESQKDFGDEPLLETEGQMPMQKSPEIEDLITVFRGEYKVKTSYGSDSLNVSSPDKTSYTDDVFFTDTENETDLGNPIDDFTAFSQYPRNPPKDDNKTNNGDDRYKEHDLSDGTFNPEASSNKPIFVEGWTNGGDTGILHAPPDKENNSFENLVEDLFDLGSEMESDGGMKNEVKYSQNKQRWDESLSVTEEACFGFEKDIDNNLRSLEILDLENSDVDKKVDRKEEEEHQATAAVGLFDKADKYNMGDSGSKLDTTDKEISNEGSKTVVPVYSLPKTDIEEDEASKQFEKNIEYKPKINIVSRRRSSITISSSRTYSTGQSSGGADSRKYSANKKEKQSLDQEKGTREEKRDEDKDKMPTRS